MSHLSQSFDSHRTSSVNSSSCSFPHFRFEFVYLRHGLSPDNTSDADLRRAQARLEPSKSQLDVQYAILTGYALPYTVDEMGVAGPD